MKPLHCVALLLCLVAAPAMRSQQAPAARVRYLSGSVQATLADNSAAPVDVVPNMPLPAGERLNTGDSGELEVEFPDGSVLRMTPNSQALLGSLGSSDSSREVQIELDNGLFYLELRSSDRATYSITAGDEQITPDQNSAIRVKLDEPPAEVSVLQGGVTVVRSGGFSVAVDAGQSLRGDPKSTRRYLLSQGMDPESWDNWNESRAQTALDESNSQTPVRDGFAGDAGYGWSDLDAQGSWYSVPGEGMVWQPSSADDGFDPYANGSWVAYPTVGYVFVSAYSWGWLPYHCGSWNWWNGFGWGWTPSSGCAVYGSGYGYIYGGQRWNVKRIPPRYRFPTAPVRPRDGQPVVQVRAIPPSHPGTGAGTTARTGTAPVRIGDTVATRIRPISAGYTSRGQSAVGSSLRMDFPVRPGTHEAVLGDLTRRTPVRPAPAAAGFTAPGQHGQTQTLTGDPVRTSPPLSGGMQHPLPPTGRSHSPAVDPADLRPAAGSAPVTPGRITPGGGLRPGSLTPTTVTPTTVVPIPVIAPPQRSQQPVGQPSAPRAQPQPSAAPQAPRSAPAPSSAPSPSAAPSSATHIK